MGVLVTKFIQDFNLKIHTRGSEDAAITLVESNRCGLQFVGFYGHFERKRIQIIGNVEYAYLQSLAPLKRVQAIEKLISQDIPCVIFTNHLVNDPADLVYLEYFGMLHDRWILSTEQATSQFIVSATLYLQKELADNTICHGVLLDVYGLGVLITGDSGVGKSETALDLIREGHLLIADDAVVVKKIGQDTLLGTCVELTKNLMEIRGIGIININSLLGKRAIRKNKSIDIVMNLEQWDDSVHYDHVGDTFEKTSILDVEVPLIRIPVKPGRNLAAIVEVAALNYRQNVMGYNAARELSNTIKRLNQT